MGTLYCLKCDQTVEADTFAEADALIDHGAKSIKCSADRNNIRWNNEAIVKTVSLIDEKVAPKIKATVSTKSKKK